MRIPPDYINKTVRFRWNRQELSFHLSHGLFSSFDIDAGTQMLLKSLVGTANSSTVKSVLDAGCGTGVIGISLKKHDPELRLVMQDRDALAVALSRENCGLNGISDADIRGELALTGLESERFDLIVSNFPAKAGLPVLRSFIRGASGLLNPGGKIAMVIVAPLAETVESEITACGGIILHSEKNRNYSVFHYTAPPADTVRDLPVYIRKGVDFTISDRSFRLDTVFDLPDFDTPGFRHVVTASLLKGFSPSGDILFWNPGQGHIPVFLLERSSETQKRKCSFHIAGNDLLEIQITGRNLDSRHPEVRKSTLHIPFESALQEKFPEASFDTFIVDLRPIPGVNWREHLVKTARHLVRKNGTFICMGKSTWMAILEKDRRFFRVTESGKLHGYRTLAMRKV